MKVADIGLCDFKVIGVKIIAYRFNVKK